MRADSVAAMAQALAAGLATGRSVVLARVWMVYEAGQELHLLGSAGTPSGGGSYRRLDGDFSRIPLGAGKIGGIATTGQPLIARSLRGDEAWLANPAWAARQGVRALMAYPLSAGDEVVGVLAVFDRERPSDQVLIDLPFVADVAAARVPDLRARETPPPALNDRRPSEQPPPAEVAGEVEASVITRDELRWFEKQNIAAALARTGGKIFGADGAAALLGMRPTTLASRIKALGIR